MGLGTLYGAEHSAMGLSTPLWGRGHSMGCSVVYWSILVYTGRRRPPLPVSLSVPLSDPPKGKWEEMGGGGGANFGAKSPLFGAFWAALWGEKRPFGAKRRHLGAEVPNLGQNGLLFGVGAPQIWGKRFNFRSAFPNSGPKAAILG